MFTDLATGRPHRAAVVALAGLVGALALVAAQGARAGAGVSTAFPVDHYACYPAHLAGGKRPQVTLKNQFGSGVATPATPATLCAPADKNGGGIINKSSHLTCFTLTGVQWPSGFRHVSISNQFGVGQKMTVTLNPVSLCAPSSKVGVGVAPPPVPTKPDHYLCFPVDAGSFAPRQVSLADQFGTSTDTVVAARTLCVPTSKNGSPFVQPKVHLLCYALKSTTVGHAVVVRNQFGILNGAIGKRSSLCVPSLKRVLS